MAKKSRILPGIARKGKLGEVMTRTTVVEQPANAQRLAQRRAKALVANAFGPVRVAAAPVAYGNTVVSSRARTTQRNNGVVVSGRDVLTTVKQTAGVSWQLGALLPVHPAYYNGTTLANYCRAYTQYRFTRLKYTFITKQPTSVTGQVILSHRRNAAEPVEDGNAAIFIPRVMSRKNAVMGPMWSNHELVVDVDSEVRLVDAFITDWQDNVLGDLEVYVQSDAATDAGYIMLDYAVEFMTPIVSPHLTQLPLPVGANTALTLTVAANVAPAIGQGLDITASGIPTGTDPYRQTVWKVVLDLDQSTVAANFAAGFTNPRINPGTTTVSYSNSTTGFTLVDGVTLYMLFGSSGFAQLYATYDQACASALGGLLVVNTGTAFATATTLVGQCYMVRYKPAELISSS